MRYLQTGVAWPELPHAIRILCCLLRLAILLLCLHQLILGIDIPTVFTWLHSRKHIIIGSIPQKSFPPKIQQPQSLSLFAGHGFITFFQRRWPWYFKYCISINRSMSIPTPLCSTLQYQAQRKNPSYLNAHLQLAVEAGIESTCWGDQACSHLLRY